MPEDRGPDRSGSDRFTCSAASTERGEPVFATGSVLEGWLLVEVRGSWGADAVVDSALGAHLPAGWIQRLGTRRIRVVCIRSPTRREASDVQMFACAARPPGRRPAVLWHRTVASLDQVVPAADELAVDRRPEAPWVAVDRPIFLVCTNGRHDQCCANLGRPLVRALRDSPWADRVWESSHVGGDRFAPNIVALPHSIYFGRVGPEAGPDVLARFDEGRLDLDHLRGRTAYTMTEQAVEHFVRRELEVDGVDAVIVEPAGDDGSHRVTVGERALRVRIRRLLVVEAEPLTCNGPPGRRTPRYSLVSIDDV